MKVFLAHASAQRKLCEKIVAKLRSAGVIVFYSEDTIRESETFDRRIGAEIARCDAMIFLISPRSVAEGCYALTELNMAGERWPNPEGRVLAVVAEETPLDAVPAYLRDTIQLFRPRGDPATDTTRALIGMRRRRRRATLLKFLGAALLTLGVTAGFIWKTRLAFEARQEKIALALIDVALQAPVYTDTCVKRLDSFALYTHAFPSPEHECDAHDTVESLPLPALVVAQTGYGKKGFLQTLRGTLARRKRPAVLMTYRDCMRGRPKTAALDLQQCLIDKVRAETSASPEDAATWLADPKRYVVIFDAIDDSASRERVFADIRLLWQLKQRGGTVVLSSQPENLNFVLARYGLEEWAVWVRDKLPTVDIRGINFNSVQRIATNYEEHRVPAELVRTILDFPQQCPDAAAQIGEWASQPKLFREKGMNSVAPVAQAIRALRGKCEGWRGTVLGAMLRARLWSYCHDELCDYEADADKLIRISHEVRKNQSVTEAELDSLARKEGFRDADALAFPLLSIGVLFTHGRQVMVDTEWIPE